MDYCSFCNIHINRIFICFINIDHKNIFFTLLINALIALHTQSTLVSDHKRIDSAECVSLSHTVWSQRSDLIALGPAWSIGIVQDMRCWVRR